MRPHETAVRPAGLAGPGQGRADESLTASTARVASEDRSVRASPGRARRRRRWPAVLLVLVLLLGAAGAGAEYLARSQVETVVRAALPGLSQDATVATEGLVLRQLVDGSLRSLVVRASGLSLETGGAADGASAQGDGGAGSLSLTGVSARVTQVGLRSPYTAASIEASGTVPWDQAGVVLAQAAPQLAGTTLSVGQVGTSAQDPGAVVAQTSAAGVEATADILPSVGADGGLVLTVASVTVGGVRAELGTCGTEGGDSGGDSGCGLGDSLLGSLGLDTPQITVPAEDLPHGLRLSEVRVADAGLSLRLEGSNVELAGM